MSLKFKFLVQMSLNGIELGIENCRYQLSKKVDTDTWTIHIDTDTKKIENVDTDTTGIDSFDTDTIDTKLVSIISKPYLTPPPPLGESVTSYCKDPLLTILNESIEK